MSKKIFIPTIGTLGDVQPFLILAKKLKKRGHTVWLGVHKRFEGTVKAAGKCCKLTIQRVELRLIQLILSFL
jgi:UDP:flavonoid glycosyltransferase YjiC (YdhE family)